MRFDGKVALITGSSRGIGRALAVTLARGGATLIIHYKQNETAAREAVAAVEAAGGQAWAVSGDLEDTAAIESIFTAVRARHDHLDIFVANAAASAFKPFLALRPHHLERTFNLNVRAFVLCAQQAAAMMAAGGRILALSSYGSIRAFPTYANLGASKAAVEAWVRFMAEELGPRDINVNAINAGFVETDSLHYFYSQPGAPSLETILSRLPKRRAASAQEVANAGAFLLSDEASYITGTTLMVDGGLSVVAPPFAAEWGQGSGA